MVETEVARLARVRALTGSGMARTIRVAAGVSLIEIARAVPCSPSTVFRWERSQRTPHGPRALRYLELLESLVEKWR